MIPASYSLTSAQADVVPGHCWAFPVWSCSNPLCLTCICSCIVYACAGICMYSCTRICALSVSYSDAGGVGRQGLRHHRTRASGSRDGRFDRSHRALYLLRHPFRSSPVPSLGTCITVAMAATFALYLATYILQHSLSYPHRLLRRNCSCVAHCAAQGLADEDDFTGTFLGNFTYDITANRQVQTFDIRSVHTTLCSFNLTISTPSLSLSPCLSENLLRAAHLV